MASIMQQKPTTPIANIQSMPPAHMQQYNPLQHPQQMQSPHPSMNPQMNPSINPQMNQSIPQSMNQQMNPAMNNPSANQQPRNMNREQMVSAFRERLVVSGERQKLKELLKARLINTTWRSAVENQCKSVMQHNGLEHTTFDLLVAQSQKTARDSVPHHVKQEMQEQIRRSLATISRTTRPDQQQQQQQQQHHMQQPNMQPNMQQPNMQQHNMQQPNMQPPHPHHGTQRMRDSM